MNKQFSSDSKSNICGYHWDEVFYTAVYTAIIYEIALLIGNQGKKDDFSICDAHLSLANAGQRKPVFLYWAH